MSYETIIQSLIVGFVFIAPVASGIYGIVVGDFKLLDKTIKLIYWPIILITAYYF